MTEATREQLEREVIHALHKYGVEQGCVPLTEELMETVCKAWVFGKNAGFREGQIEARRLMLWTTKAK